MKYLLSFIEEVIYNKKYRNYTGGRLEVYDNQHEYAIEEVRFFTPKQKEFYKFREKWDFKDVDLETLNKIKKIIKEKYDTKEL